MNSPVVAEHSGRWSAVAVVVQPPGLVRSSRAGPAFGSAESDAAVAAELL